MGVILELFLFKNRCFIEDENKPNIKERLFEFLLASLVHVFSYIYTLLVGKEALNLSDYIHLELHELRGYDQPTIIMMKEYYKIMRTS